MIKITEINSKISHRINVFFTKGHERTVLAKKNIISSLIIKGVSLSISLALVPLTLNYINSEQFGIWLTLSSIISWFSFFDLGFGHGLRNKLIEAKVKNNFTQAKIFISTTYAILLLIFSSVWIIFFICNLFLDWSKILNTSTQMTNELSSLALLVVSFFCCQIVLKVISTVFIADQLPSIAALFDVIGQFGALISIYLLLKSTSGSLLKLSIAYSLPPLIVLAFATIFSFKHKYNHFTPSYKLVNLKEGIKILKLGSKFFVIQVAVVIIYQTNNIIITQINGPSDVTIYNIAYKYLTIVLMSFSIIISPFWTAFSEAFLKKDVQWMKNTLKKLRRISYLFIIITIVFVSFSNFFYHIWIGNNIHVPLMVTISIGFYITAINITSLHTQILNGIGKIKIQLIAYSLAIFFHIPLALYLGRKIGMSGVIISATLFYSIISLLTYKQVNLIIGNKATAIWNE